MSKIDDPNRFNYQLLGRLQQDCDYYLGNGNRSKKHLWAGDEAEQIKKMKELYEGLPEKPQWITPEDIARYAEQFLASAYYEAHSSKCSALLGRYLFEDLQLTEEDFQSKEVLLLCTGDCQWTPVQGGMEAMLREVRREVELNDQAGILGRDLAEDWGVIANDAGQIIARAGSNGGVRKQRFLGVSGGPLETMPVTVQRVGIAWQSREIASNALNRPRG